MRTFYTGSDIEDLAARGVRQLDTGADVFLTDAARERAEELGIVLIVPGSIPTGKVAAPAAPAKSNSLPDRPRLPARSFICEGQSERICWKRKPDGGSTCQSGKRSEEARRLICVSQK